MILANQGDEVRCAQCGHALYTLTSDVNPTTLLDSTLFKPVADSPPVEDEGENRCRRCGHQWFETWWQFIDLRLGELGTSELQ